MIENIITVKNMNKSFESASGKINILKDINFTIAKGSLTIIFGPSGSGKSTLLNTLTGLEPPTSGHVVVKGQELYDLPTDMRAHFRAQSMGIVHQVNYWIKSLSVLENVAMPMYLSGSQRSEALKSARSSLEHVGMIDYASYRPNMLSGGQQQRVSMARALVADTDIIMADEPTGNLDSASGQMIIDLLLSCKQNLNRTIVLITHNIEYLPISDKQLYIRDGKLNEVSHGQKMPADILESLKAQVDELQKMEEGS